MQIKSRSEIGIRIELDEKQIYPQDPGQGTPVLVVLTSGETASWNCATCEGEVDGVQLTDDQKEWLDEKTPEVEKWMQKHGC